MTHPEHSGFQRAGLLTFLIAFSLLSMLFAPALRDDVLLPERATALDPDYRLEAGDAVRISVRDGAGPTLEARIGTNGWISHPALGKVRIGGMTVGAAEARIAARLVGPGGFGIPTVTVLVLEAFSATPSVSERSSPRNDTPARAGEVQRPLARSQPSSPPRKHLP